MIYLGDNIPALGEYSKEAICWLSINIKGRKTAKNSTGHKCTDLTCKFCNSKLSRRRSMNPDFINLFDDNIILTIITGKPDALILQYRALEQDYMAAGFTPANFKTEAKKLFLKSGYKGWFLNKNRYDISEKWNYKLARLINKHTCTYCNREYTFTFENSSGGKGMVPQFDHWFSKSKYPLLAISFYNLIPSCATCNSIKSITDLNLVEHLHPYRDANISSSYRFSYLMRKPHKPEISFVNNAVGDYKGIKTALALNLPLIYKGHSGKELQDLYDLRYKYNDNYLDILLEKTFSKKLRISNEEKYRIVFGIEIDSDYYHKRIMSKFKADIINKLLKIS